MLQVCRVPPGGRVSRWSTLSVVEQRACRWSSQRRDQSRPRPSGQSDHHRVDVETGLRPSSTSGGYRWSSSERPCRWSSSERSERSVETPAPHRWSSSEVRWSSSRTRSVETTTTRSIASPGFETGLRPSSTSGGYRWSSSERPAGGRAASAASDQSRPPQTRSISLTGFRQDFVLPQPAVGTGGRAASVRTGGRAVERPAGGRAASEASDQSRPPQRGRSPHRVSRQDFVLPQPAVGTGGRARQRDQSRPPQRGRSPHWVSSRLSLNQRWVRWSAAMQSVVEQRSAGRLPST